jgi:hypothetical protein
LFADLCGQDVMRNVVLATTMWNQVDENVGIQRENELKEIWRSILAKGSVARRFTGTFESAWDIVDVVAEKNRVNFVHTSESFKASSRTIIPSSELQCRRIAASEITDDDFLIV